MPSSKSSSAKSNWEAVASQKDIDALKRMMGVHERNIKAQATQIQDLKRQVNNIQGLLSSLQTAVSRLR